MAGKNGYRWIQDRVFEDLTSLKKHARLQGRVAEVRFSHVMATGGAGAAIEIEETTGSAIAQIGAEAQVYIRASNDDGDYDTETITLSWLDDDGVIYAPVTTTITATNSSTEVAVSGATTFYRVRELTCSKTPKTGHLFTLGDADHNPNGGGGDVYGMIEENNYSEIASRYFVPSADANGKTMYSYLGYMKGKYFTTNNDQGEPIEYCTLAVTCTPDALGYETTLNYKIYVGDVFEWQAPFKLKAATDTSFIVTDDAGTGGNFEFEYIIVESTRLV